MELDVHLTREGQEPWGFEIVEDIGIPLTIDKVYPSSPAAAVGLQPGDSITRIGDKLTTELTLDAALDIIGEAIGSLSLGITRGLYEPVLDDYEPIYEPIEPVDFDRQSATEVYLPDCDARTSISPNFDSNNQNRSDLSHSQTPYDFSAQLLSTSHTSQDFSDALLSASQTPYDPSALLLSTSHEFSAPFDSRSLTASPFACNKIYRPFSTEPLEVPPLDDPIILNPDYKDDFTFIDETTGEEIVKTKFKLPISEQYDPNYKKKVAEILENIGKEKKDTKTDVKSKLIEKESATTNVTKAESKYNEVESTKTEQISTKVDWKTKIADETVSQTVDIIETNAKSKEILDKSQITEKTEIDIENIEKTAVQIVEENIEKAVSVTEEIQKEIAEELRASATRELEWSAEVTKIQTSHVKEEVTNLTRENMIRSELQEQSEPFKEIKSQHILSEDISKTVSDNKISLKEQSYIEEVHNFEAVDIKNAESLKQDFEKHEKFIKEDSKVTSNEFKERTEMNYAESLSETESKQMAYKMGLKTIPNIRGMVQSSHHFDLLLRTFFIHLTDVMVVLSRFILTQPITELNNKSEKVIKEKLITGFNEVAKTSEKKREMKKEESVMKSNVVSEERKKHEIRTVDQKQATEVKRIDTQTQEFAVKNGTVDSAIEKKRLTGAKIAQTQQMKSKELTQKMDAVITEFETKSGIEETIERRRSRSRSRIEEEVMSESDPLEWLDKVNRSSQERTEISSTRTATSEINEVKSKHRTTKPGKQMYIATVESHVYTNQDAILEEQLSETSSVQSSEEVNTALEVTDTCNENVAVKTSLVTAEKQKAVEVITNALEDVVQEKQEILESVTEYDRKKAESVSTTIMEDTKVIATAESIQSSTELKHEEIDIKETKSQQAVISSEQSFKSALKNTDISLESTKEFTESKINTQNASTKQEFLSTTASESIETSTESNVHIFESKSIRENVASVISSNEFKAVAVESIEIPLEATTEVKEQKTVVHDAVAKQELLSNIASEATEVVNLESTAKTKLFEATTKTASVTSESNYKSTVIQSETLIEESNAEIKDVKVKEETASTKIEPLSIATAETTNISIDDQVESFEIQTLDSKKAAVKTEQSYKSVAIESTEVALEVAEEQHNISLKKEALIKEDTRYLSVAGIIETKTEQDKVKTQTYDEGHAALKIIKEEVTTIDNSIEINESELNTHKSLQITDIESHKAISNHGSKSKLRLQTTFTANGDLVDTPTPSTVPPTPLTDEYVFKLTIPLPKSRGTTPIPEEIDHEDPHIVKKRLIPHIETKIEDQIIYDPPLPTPTGDKREPVYTKPGLRGGGYIPRCRKEYIREIERKSSLLASAIDETIKSIEVYKEEVGIDKPEPIEEKEEETKVIEDGENNVDISEELIGYRPVAFNPDVGKDKRNVQVTFQVNMEEGRQSRLYTDASGEPLGTAQGIVDGLEEATVNENVAKELGKPGLTEEKIAELISGESEMLREAHVMGLSRVLSSHMHRPDDSVDFKKIKPLVESLKDSEVLKALNEELLKTQAEKKKKDDKKWTTFLQKPKRPVPKPKFGCHGYVEQDYIETDEPYKVKIVKQPKPKVAPDYKPEDFETGPLPWEERALNETPPPPIEPEEPILIPEGTPEFLEAVDPLPESEVPDLEDTGIPLPSPRQLVTPEAPKEEVEQQPSEPEVPEEPIEENPKKNPVEDTSMADKREVNPNALIESIKNMVDPSAPIEQQLNQMRAQLAALAQLPCVIQQSLEMLTKQLMMVGQQESMQAQCKMESQSTEETSEYREENIITENAEEVRKNHEVCIEEMLPPIEEVKEENSPQPCEEEKTVEVKNEQEVMMEQDEKQKKLEILHQAIEEQMRLDQESRQLKQRPTPRVGKPKPVFGPLHPEERPLVLPGGRKWRGPKDVMNDQMIAETLQGQAEVIQGKVMGINFMKYEKPPVSLDHLKNSEVYKVVHNMDNTPLKRVELLTPVVAEADYRERCRSATPSRQHTGPQQLQP